MSEMEHTPGPWICDEAGIVRHQNASGYWEAVVHATAWIEDAWDRDPLALANGRMFAAAPDLYEALSAMLELGCSPTAVTDHPVVKEARAALSKAKAPTE